MELSISGSTIVSSRYCCGVTRTRTAIGSK
jgi:hypothetical protein